MSEISEAAKAKAVELAKAAGSGVGDWNDLGQFASGDALARFIQQVSDATKAACDYGIDSEGHDALAPFILPEPVDPLQEALREAYGAAAPEFVAAARSALLRQGFEIAPIFGSKSDA